MRDHRFSVVYWNPQWSAAQWRYDEISLKNFDMIILFGTGEPYAVRTTKTRHSPYHVVFCFGWKKTPFSNKSCGCANMINKKLETIVAKAWGPKEKSPIIGRTGAVFIRTNNATILLQAFYLCPASFEEAHREKVAQEVCKHMKQNRKNCGERTLTLTAGDANGAVGFNKKAGGIKKQGRRQ